ncbi:E3 ubiquitin-protein ligase TRIM41, partial [Acanthisitta chloris]
DITLDPCTAHSRLNLSLDLRSVRLSERRSDPSGYTSGSDLSVLGTPGFTSGRHYWEVEVKGRRGWAVGAMQENAGCREKSLGRETTPRREIWAIGSNGKKFHALTATEQTVLALLEQPKRFGIYLDYERGQLGFYDAENMSHIHTFRVSFRRQIFPFFRVLAKGTRLRIC